MVIGGGGGGGMYSRNSTHAVWLSGGGMYSCNSTHGVVVGGGGGVCTLAIAHMRLGGECSFTMVALNTDQKTTAYHRGFVIVPQGHVNLL